MYNACMRRPGFLGDLDGFWFSGLGLVTTVNTEGEAWDRYGRDIASPYTPQQMLGPAVYQREAQLSQLSRAQGWLTTGPVKQHMQLPVATPRPASVPHVWAPFDFENGV
jgi:hypothetical protein